MKYKTVIGLEFHCEMKSNTKVFSNAKNGYSKKSNSYVAPIDMAFPGTLPVVNMECVKKALMMSIILGCKTPEYMQFDRKNYFYPDLPKGYQITQSHKPFGENGYLMINVDDYDKKVLIHDIHLEEDTASIDHYSDYSLLDYNRAGMPLVEIVTEPCLNSGVEALAFLDYLRRAIIYLDLSEARVDKGQMRCDVNISLMGENDKELGTKVEIKNINSFYNVKDAIEYEIKRQSELLDMGEKIIQETRRYDDTTKTTISMRSKVDAVDYKYFVEPNIPNIKIEKEFIDDIKESLVPLAYDRRKYYIDELGLTSIDANTIVKDRNICEYFEKCINEDINAKEIANWLNGNILAYLNKNSLNINDIYLLPKMLVELIKLVIDNKITSKQGKELLNKALEERKDPLTLYKELNITQVDNVEELRIMIKNIIKNNPTMVNKYIEGRNVMDFFIGQVMKETKGKANPKITSGIVKEELDSIK